MAPKKRTSQREKVFTLEQGKRYLTSLANATNSIKNWTDALATLVHYYNSENPSDTDMSKAEMLEQYKDVNLYPILKDFDKVVEIIDTKIMSSRSNQPIAVDTRKQYYLSIIRVSQKKSPLQIDKDIRAKYMDKLAEIEGLSNAKRNLNKPIRANLEYPDFVWTNAQDEYENYITTHAFTNTAKGRKELRIACLCGLYVLQRPRRLEYRLLQYYGKKPSESEYTNRNILYSDDGKLYVSLDIFKTRYRTSGASTEKKELLPRYVKEINPKLASLLRDYLKKWEIKDMSKLSPAEKRQKKEYYVFFKESGTHEEPYEDTTYSKYMTSCFKQVFNRGKLSVNTFRHMFNSWVAENLQQFNDAQLQAISVDVGDTPRNMPTAMRYRIQYVENQDMDKTQIEGNVLENEFVRKMVEANAEEEGSVGNVEDGNKDHADEVVSPNRDFVMPISVDTSAELDVLYKQVGKAYMELKSLELTIIRKLGM
jgi:hypothetical protein